MDALLRIQNIIIEMHLVQRLIHGTIIPFIREDGSIALWAILPTELKKYYCIRMLIRNNIKDRVKTITIEKNCTYLVSVPRTISILLVWSIST